jgi:hypothetical protein
VPWQRSSADGLYTLPFRPEAKLVDPFLYVGAIEPWALHGEDPAHIVQLALRPARAARPVELGHDGAL